MLAFLAAAESTIAVSRRLRVLSGAPIVSVEVVREVLAQRGFVGVVERLTPRGRLRAHALVRVGEGETRLPAAADALRIEVGLVPTMPLGAELAELSVLEPSAGERAPFVQRLDAKMATVVVLELSGSSSEAAVVKLIADGSSRRVVWWQAHADERDQALRLRRDVDLEGAVLVVSGPAPIGALLAPPPIAPAAPPLVVLLGGELTEREVSAPWVLRRDRVATERSQRAAAQRDGSRTPARTTRRRSRTWDLAAGSCRAARGLRTHHRRERARRGSTRARRAREARAPRRGCADSRRHDGAACRDGRTDAGRARTHGERCARACRLVFAHR